MRKILLLWICLILSGCITNYSSPSSVDSGITVSDSDTAQGFHPECVEWKNVSTEIYHESEVDPWCYKKECYAVLDKRYGFCKNLTENYDWLSPYEDFKECKDFLLEGKNKEYDECRYQEERDMVFAFKKGCVMEPYVENRTEEICVKEMLFRDVNQ